MGNKYLIDETTLSDIADAIREKTSQNETILVGNYAEQIRNIPTAPSIETCTLTIDDGGAGYWDFWLNCTIINENGIIQDVHLTYDDLAENISEYGYIYLNNVVKRSLITTEQSYVMTGVPTGDIKVIEYKYNIGMGLEEDFIKVFNYPYPVNPYPEGSDMESMYLEAYIYGDATINLFAPGDSAWYIPI